MASWNLLQVVGGQVKGSRVCVQEEGCCTTGLVKWYRGGEWPVGILNNSNMLTPYEQFHIQAFHQKGKLIPEQYNNTQVIQTLSFNWPFTPPYHLTRSIVQHPSSWTHTLLPFI